LRRKEEFLKNKKCNKRGKKLINLIKSPYISTKEPFLSKTVITVIITDQKRLPFSKNSFTPF
jgi:hypothetical protein